METGQFKTILMWGIFFTFFLYFASSQEIIDRKTAEIKELKREI